MTNTTSNPRRARRNMKSRTSPTRASQMLDTQIARVRRADAKVHSSGWDRARELARLVRTYKDCYGTRPRAKKLAALTGLALHRDRQMLHARLAEFFPAETEVPGVGIRVYEAVYKFNRVLRRQKKQPFTAEEISAFIRESPNPYIVCDKMAYARQMSIEEWRAESDKTKQEIYKNPRSVTVNKKAWLHGIEFHPPAAIAAAIAIREEDRPGCERAINDHLQQLGCDLRLKSPDIWIQRDLYDPEPGDELIDQQAAEKTAA